MVVMVNGLLVCMSRQVVFEHVIIDAIDAPVCTCQCNPVWNACTD